MRASLAFSTLAGLKIWLSATPAWSCHGCGAGGFRGASCAGGAGAGISYGGAAGYCGPAPAFQTVVETVYDRVPVTTCQTQYRTEYRTEQVPVQRVVTEQVPVTTMQ